MVTTPKATNKDVFFVIDSDNPTSVRSGRGDASHAQTVQLFAGNMCRYHSDRIAM
jgi:hypothetical protein